MSQPLVSVGDPASFPRVLLSCLALVALGTIAAAPAAAQVHGKVVSPPANHWSKFGIAVDASPDTLVAGATDSIRNDDATNCSFAYPGFGSVAVFTKGTSGWTLSQTLWHDHFTDTNDWEPHFGSSVSLRGDTLVVGAERLPLNGVFEVGGFYLFQRTSPSATFTRAGPFFAPNPIGGARLGEIGGVATNGRFVAITNHTQPILFYQIQGASVAFVGSVSLPVAAPPEKIYITDNDVLVGMISGFNNLVAFKLSPTGAVAIDTSSLNDGSSYTRPASADGNTFVSGLNGDRTLFRVVAFGVNSVASIKDLTVPIPPGLPNPPTANSPVPTGIGIKEGSGIYVGFTGTVVADAYLAGFLSSSYQLVSTVRPTQMAEVVGTTTWGHPVSFNGEDLFLSDFESGPSSACVDNFPSRGYVDGFIAGGRGVGAELASLVALY